MGQCWVLILGHHCHTILGNHWDCENRDNVGTQCWDKKEDNLVPALGMLYPNIGIILCTLCPNIGIILCTLCPSIGRIFIDNFYILLFLSYHIFINIIYFINILHWSHRVFGHTKFF